MPCGGESVMVCSTCNSQSVSNAEPNCDSADSLVSFPDRQGLGMRLLILLLLFLVALCIVLLHCWISYMLEQAELKVKGVTVGD